MRQSVLKRKSPRGLPPPTRPAGPLDKVVRLYGSREAAALALGVTVDGLKKMMRPVARGGGGGLVPARRQKLLLEDAVRRGFDLAPADLIAEPY